jgi:hypothetical protein
MKSAALIIALGFLAVGFAGCAQDDDISAQDTGAPLSPRQLRVGQALLGEYMRMAINATGHHVTYHYDGRNSEEKVEPLNDHDYIERRIESTMGRDRYWAEFPAIQYQQRLTDLDPDDGQTAVYNQQTTYRQSDRHRQYDDIQTAYTFSSTNCGANGCQTERSTEEVDYRFYHHTGMPVDALNLAGRVLTLGRTTTVNYTFTDERGLIHAQWANYTAKREVELHGERTFLVEAKYDYKILNLPREKGEDAQAPSAPSGGILPTGRDSKLPKPVSEIYYSARLSNPVKQVYKMPFEHEGRLYWTNITYEVEAYEPGAGAIPWGNEARQNVSKAGQSSIPFAELQSNLNMKGLTYPFAQAWKNMRADPTLVEFNRVASKPGAVPIVATYFPDASRFAYTWTMQAVDDNGQGAQVSARLQQVGPSSGVFVPQEKEFNLRRGGIRALTAESVGQRTFAKGDDVFATFRTVRPGSWEPAVLVNLFSYAEAEFTNANVVFANPSSVRPLFAGGRIIGGELLRARDTVSVSAFDGGLENINVTWMTVSNEWPFMPPFGVPVPPQQEQAADDMRRIERLDQPWT